MIVNFSYVILDCGLDLSPLQHYLPIPPVMQARFVNILLFTKFSMNKIIIVQWLYVIRARNYRPGFVKASPIRSFSMTENQRFELVFTKTGSINWGTGVVKSDSTVQYGTYSGWKQLYL